MITPTETEVTCNNRMNEVDYNSLNFKLRDNIVLMYADPWKIGKQMPY